MASARQRLLKEYKEASKQKTLETGITLIPNESNLFSWRALLKGPEATPFASGVFELVLNVPEQYPLVPPAVRFRTRVFHPNVHFKTGEICLDILKTAWSPAWTLHSVCQAVLALLSAPAADSPLNCDAGNLLRSGDVMGYNSLARMYTLEHAQPSLASSTH
ncbi:ubiquitin-conjugating enzyme/RWD-like protein [Haematococcus lacustris]